MVRHLESRVFSSETLVAGVDMVEMGAGLPSPPSDTFELMQELASLEAHITMLIQSSREGIYIYIWNKH